MRILHRKQPRFCAWLNSLNRPTRHEFHMTSSVQFDIFMPVDCCDSDIFSTGVGEFIHYLMLKTWVDKTESVKFKDIQFVQSNCIKISLLRRRCNGNCWEKCTQATDLYHQKKIFRNTYSTIFDAFSFLRHWKAQRECMQRRLAKGRKKKAKIRWWACCSIFPFVFELNYFNLVV